MPTKTFSSEVGYRRCHGESASMNVMRDEVVVGSLCTKMVRLRTGTQSEPGRSELATGCARDGRAEAESRSGVQSALPGVKTATYSTTGSSWEHRNLSPDAEPARARQAAKSSVVPDEGQRPRVVGA